MISTPDQPLKGVSLIFALAKSQLLLSVSNPHFSQTQNINRVHVIYRSAAGNQHKRLTFDWSEYVPIARAKWSVRSRNQFYIESISLVDHDGDVYVLPQNMIPAGKGIDFQPSGTSGGGSQKPQIRYFGFEGTNDDSIAGFDVGKFFA